MAEGNAAFTRETQQYEPIQELHHETPDDLRIRRHYAFFHAAGSGGECAANAPALEEGTQAWVTTSQPADQTTLCVRVVVRGKVVRDGVFSGYVRYRAATHFVLGRVATRPYGSFILPPDSSRPNRDTAS